jgi:hypothetical protein
MSFSIASRLASNRRIYGPRQGMRKGLLAAALLSVPLLAGQLAACNRNAKAPPPAPSAVQAAAGASTQTVAAPTPVAAPTRTAFDELLDRIERKVKEIRGLNPGTETKRRFVDSATLTREIDRHLDKPEAQQQLARDQQLYRLLGLIGPDDDLNALYRALLGSQILGLYDDETDEFLVLQAGEDLSALAESTYAHEYVHRLQDVTFDLGALGNAADGNSDRELALSALIEGDAVVAQLGYGIRYMSRSRLTDLIRSASDVDPPPEGTPFVLLKGLKFPYTAGPTFVGALRGRDLSFEAVDRAFGVPPVSTEQIIHPEKYRSGEGPVEMPVPDLASAFGSDWTAQRADVLGEFLLSTWLTALGRSNAAQAAAGWGGDWYQVWNGPEGQATVVARIVWDRPEEDGSEFFDSLVAGLEGSRELRRVGTIDGRRAVWQGDRRAIGVELAASGGGTVLVAAERAEQVTKLLEAMTRP